MTSQPRQPAGMRTGGEPTGGRFASKTAPTIKGNDLGFGTEQPAGEHTEHKVKLWDLQTTFTRRITADGTVTVTVDCDDPAILLLARKGDVGYWSGDIWKYRHKDRRVWSAEIVRRMLEEGLVAWDGTEPDAVRTTMRAVAGPTKTSTGTHALTKAVAQIRGLRLIQSMVAGHEQDWYTKIGRHPVPSGTGAVLLNRFEDAVRVYKLLPHPPWEDPSGYETDLNGGDCFVGEHGDLLWRVLTETDHHGMSPLEQGLISGRRSQEAMSMVVTAALYDETAQHQLTTGLFDVVAPSRRAAVQKRVLQQFRSELEPWHGECRWTSEQQERLRGFTDTVKAGNYAPARSAS